MTIGHEDFERCPTCGHGLEPRVVGAGHVETVEESILHGDPSTAALMVCTNPDCPTQQTPEPIDTP